MIRQKFYVSLILGMFALSSFAMESEQSSYCMSSRNATKLIKKICLLAIKDAKIIASLEKKDQELQSCQTESYEHYISAVKKSAPNENSFVGHFKLRCDTWTAMNYSETQLENFIKATYNDALFFATETYPPTEQNRKLLEQTFPLAEIIKTAKETTKVDKK